MCIQSGTAVTWYSMFNILSLVSSGLWDTLCVRDVLIVLLKFLAFGRKQTLHLFRSMVKEKKERKKERKKKEGKKKEKRKKEKERKKEKGKKERKK